MASHAHDRLPPWLRGSGRPLTDGRSLKLLLRRQQLHTVCEAAHCPNLGRCFKRGTATFLILGDRCTRSCGFCSIASGRPAAVDPDEPNRIATAAVELQLRHIVVTSVTRDDLDDGGAAVFVAVVKALRTDLPWCTVEVLVPDFGGSGSALEAVLGAGPDVFNHNVETVGRLYPRVRPQADLGRSLGILERASRSGLSLIKSGFMLGLGETAEEIESLLRLLLARGVQVVTIGQYLRPSLAALAVERYVHPSEFDHWQRWGMRLGFMAVSAGPEVRSSYHAEEIRNHARGESRASGRAR